MRFVLKRIRFDTLSRIIQAKTPEIADENGGFRKQFQILFSFASLSRIEKNYVISQWRRQVLRQQIVEGAASNHWIYLQESETSWILDIYNKEKTAWSKRVGVKWFGIFTRSGT